MKINSLLTISALLYGTNAMANPAPDLILPNCGQQAPTQLEDPSSPSGLDVKQIEERQKDCRQAGIGNDISTTIVLFMRLQHKLKLSDERIKGLVTLILNFSQQINEANEQLNKKPTKKEKISLNATIKKLEGATEEAKAKLTTESYAKNIIQGSLKDQAQKIKAAFPNSNPDNLPSMK